MKKYVLYVLIGVLLSSCVSLKAPNVKGIENFSVSSLSTDMKMNFNVNVSNPNNYGVTVRQMNMKLYLDDSVISSIGINGKQRIGANSNLSLPFIVEPKITKMPKLAWIGIKELLGSTDNKMKLQGEIVVSKFIFRKKYSFSLPKK
jgi:LEA14-like dessication related protein